VQYCNFCAFNYNKFVHLVGELTVLIIQYARKDNNEDFMSKFDVIGRRLPGGTEERNEQSQCGKAVYRRKFEMVVSQAGFARCSVTIAANSFDVRWCDFVFTKFCSTAAPQIKLK
jgi:hypothetical protein